MSCADFKFPPLFAALNLSLTPTTRALYTLHRSSASLLRLSMTVDVASLALHSSRGTMGSRTYSNDSNLGWVVQKFGGTSVGKFPAKVSAS